VRTNRAGRSALCILATVIAVSALAAPAWAARPRSTTTTTTPAAPLATLKIRDAEVEYKAANAAAFAAARDGQALRQGDSLRTDAEGLAEINYTDGSYTRLGPDTEFTLTRLTDQQGARQTQGTLTVGSTWNRAVEVSQSGGSFEISAGGATAAVEGTVFAVICNEEAGQLACDFFDIFDPISVTFQGTTVPLENATKVTLDQDALGEVQPVTREELVANPFINANAFLDEILQLGGFSEFPPAVVATTPPPGGGGGGGGGASAGTGGAQPAVSSAGDGGGVVGRYPPTGTIVVVNPNVPPGGTVTFSGSGCEANEHLSVLFDGRNVGTLTANAKGEFAGSLTIPHSTAPGHHTLTVRGKTCELSVVINVLGPQAQARPLAFTGSSNHTTTYLLVGAAAVLIGCVLVVGARRRRVARGAGPPAV
jgi:FecR protein